MVVKNSEAQQCANTNRASMSENRLQGSQHEYCSKVRLELTRR